MESTAELRSQQLFKRPRLEQNSSYPKAISIMELVCSSLHSSKSMISHIELSKSSSVEIEVRLGMIVKNGLRRWTSIRNASPTLFQNEGILMTDEYRHASSNGQLEFIAGIDDHVVSSFNKLFGKGEQKPIQRLRFNDNNANKIRWEVLVGKDGKEVYNPIVESKDRIKRFDIALLPYFYDIRVDINTEVLSHVNTLNPTTLSFDPSNYTLERIKRRISYIPSPLLLNNTTSYWRIDLTYVDTICPNNSINNKNSVELEFELLEDAKLKFMSCKDADFIEFNKQISYQLLQLLHMCIPSANIESSTNNQLVFYEGITSNNNKYMSIYNELMNITNHIRGYSSKSFEFIGSMPVNLLRRNIQLLYTNDYYMTEKSDGVRYLLYTIETREGGTTAVLVDRALTISVIAGGDILGECVLVCVYTYLCINGL